MSNYLEIPVTDEQDVPSKPKRLRRVNGIPESTLRGRKKSSEILRLRTQVANLKVRESDLYLQLGDTIKMRDKLQGDLDAMHRENLALDATINDLLATNEKLRTGMETLRTENSNLREMSREICNENAQARRDATTWQMKWESLLMHPVVRFFFPEVVCP
jgi:chromosome segregation ATPase